MQDSLRKHIKFQHAKKFRESLADEELFDWLKKHYGEEISSEGKCLVLYGSETGNAEDLAGQLSSDLKRRGQRVKLSALDDYDINDLENESMV